MSGVNNVNLSPIIPSQNELAQAYISTDRKSFILTIEQRLKELISDFADTSKNDIYIDGKYFADKFSAGATLFMNRTITNMETAYTTFNSVYQSLVKFEQSISQLIAG